MRYSAEFGEGIIHGYAVPAGAARTSGCVSSSRSRPSRLVHSGRRWHRRRGRFASGSPARRPPGLRFGSGPPVSGRLLTCHPDRQEAVPASSGEKRIGLPMPRVS